MHEKELTGRGISLNPSSEEQVGNGLVRLVKMSVLIEKDLRCTKGTCKKKKK